VASAEMNNNVEAMMDKYTLRFKNPRLEEAFNASRKPMMLQNMTRIAIIGIVAIGGIQQRTNGVNANGVTAKVLLFDRRYIWVLPSNLRTILSNKSVKMIYHSSHL